MGKFVGDGSGLTSVNADLLDGKQGADYAKKVAGWELRDSTQRASIAISDLGATIDDVVGKWQFHGAVSRKIMVEIVKTDTNEVAYYSFPQMQNGFITYLESSNRYFSTGVLNITALRVDNNTFYDYDILSIYKEI